MVFDSMLQKMRGQRKPARRQASPSNIPVKVDYKSNDVAIPDDFLRSAPADAQAITYERIGFKNSVLPEYSNCYAVVLDNVLSPSECAELIRLAEASVVDELKIDGSSWRPALVNMGGGYEIEVPYYRKSDRIIWDNQEIVDRMWARMAALPEIQRDLMKLPPAALLQAETRHPTYEFYRVNQRMRFLKYTPGHFFRAHCDGPYGEKTAEGFMVETHMTVHLYLNDSQQVVGPSADLLGGATSFLSPDESRKMDVDPKAGRVLVFQHARLKHQGDDVMAGTKYTVRTDILYKMRLAD